MRLAPIVQFLGIGAIVGLIVPFFLSLCMFGSTLPVFIAAEPTPGYWSGAPTPVATAAPSQVQAWTSAALHRGGAAGSVLFSVLGALAGEAAGARLPGHPWHRTRRAWLGAIAGSIALSIAALLSFLP